MVGDLLLYTRSKQRASASVYWCAVDEATAAKQHTLPTAASSGVDRCIKGVRCEHQHG